MTEHRALWRAALDAIAGQRQRFRASRLSRPEPALAAGARGPGRVGLIDFQDAVAGSRAYDLISLIEDARRDVSPALAEGATRHYLAAMTARARRWTKTRFRAEMAVMAAQRNAKIVGIFARLYKRDGKRALSRIICRASGAIWSAI